ncbi:MAG: BrnT family toxin [Deltaproteobacteria bacterium]|nr:BrnT family toxin [Deltaproteobacteria bacterium]
MDVEYWFSGVRFEWDRRKASANLRKHRVGFENACEVFFDPFIFWMGSEVVDGEERERVIGITAGWELLVVVYVDQRDSIRLISARLATGQERGAYEDQ